MLYEMVIRIYPRQISLKPTCIFLLGELALAALVFKNIRKEETVISSQHWYMHSCAELLSS